MLITAGPLASAALSAADGSWVRQVISFDEVPGTVPFCSLLSMGLRPPTGAGATDLALAPYLAGPGGLSADPVTHHQLAADLDRLSAGASITGSDVVLAAPPDGSGRDYTVLLDLALLQGATVVATPAEDLPGARRHGRDRAPGHRPAGRPGAAGGHRRLLSTRAPTALPLTVLVLTRITSSTHTSKMVATVKAAATPWMSRSCASVSRDTPGTGCRAASR
jgi:hypothetical protein